MREQEGKREREKKRPWKEKRSIARESTLVVIVLQVGAVTPRTDSADNSIRYTPQGVHKYVA